MNGREMVNLPFFSLDIGIPVSFSQVAWLAGGLMQAHRLGTKRSA